MRDYKVRWHFSGNALSRVGCLISRAVTQLSRRKKKGTKREKKKGRERQTKIRNYGKSLGRRRNSPFPSDNIVHHIAFLQAHTCLVDSRGKLDAETAAGVTIKRKVHFRRAVRCIEIIRITYNMHCLSSTDCLTLE